ncbi:SRPBCC domain-containing protein [Cohnella rhizosphaerae]|uniref:SRPBCC domain-containing protein n=1 Tax=Cohnella rhizosphaerae TaxID=1457232 RepID=A0A9X4QU56_9BACL|nr:SRPBCC domain-containing protein [Cohnella rhizosphaerae]MDG0811390.1 SRPBCC domain-containing protein [Cohnella rhizosphaerae]
MNEAENELATSRDYRFPRALVYEAWTTPEWLARWWGPKGFTNTFDVCDITPGGEWRFTMHGPDGKTYPNVSAFVEVVPQERIVIDHLSGHQFRVTATFESIADGGHAGHVQPAL